MPSYSVATILEYVVEDTATIIGVLLLAFQYGGTGTKHRGDLSKDLDGHLDGLLPFLHPHNQP